MMSNTPRVFVGATTLLIAGLTSDAALQTVTAAMNDFPGVRVIAADRITGLVTLSDDRPVNRSDLTAAITQVETNVDLEAAAFTVNVPATARPLSLETLRANGPLNATQ